MTIYQNHKPSPLRLAFSLFLLIGLTHCTSSPIKPAQKTEQSISSRQTDAVNVQVSLARSYLDQGLLDEAELTLNTINSQNISPEQRIEYHQLKSDLFMQAGNLLESAQEKTILNTLLFGTDRYLGNQRALLDTLLLLSTQSLTFLKPSFDGPLAGWMELAIAIKQHQPTDALDPALDRWRINHPEHSADTNNLSLLLKQQQIAYKTPKKVAVFLPTEGAIAGVANTIRKGILSAAFSLQNRWQPDITFYDTSSAPIETLYQQASAEGINVIIGPLEKANVAKLSELNELAIPTIALNETLQKTTRDVSYFSLSPEEEASQIASLAWLDGFRNVLIMTPESSFGRRVAGHFASIWQQLGGNVSGVQSYPSKQADYSVPIKALLKLDESINRYKRLQKRLNLNLSFEERRRHDAGFVFLIAPPREGRLIKPQLRFHRASSLAVYSTSKIYEGKLNKVANRDLDGVVFCDMPWIINTSMTTDLKPSLLLEKWHSIATSHQRFFSLGLDAYQIIPHLQRLNANPSNRFRGETGILSIDKEHSIKRQLSCAVFENGVVKPTGLAPTLNTIRDIKTYNQSTSPVSNTSFSTPL